MEIQRYHDIKELAYQKIRDRLHVTPGMKEELGTKFTDWFHKHFQSAMARQQEQAAQAAPQEGVM